MSGQMMSFDMKKNMQSLVNTPEPVPTRIAAIDYKGLISYAKSKGVEPYELDEEEKEKFVLS